jgi:hypothetical protein
VPRDYRALLGALERLDALPKGPAHDRAVAELRADLKALSAADARRLVLDVRRAALARRAHAPDRRAAA